MRKLKAMKSKRINYRKIWESYYGPIPKDENNRTYEIHHIDNNHSNNDISNLKLVTIQEHYDIHYAQGDYAACFCIATRMKVSPDELSQIMKQVQQKRLKDGTHHNLSGEHQRKHQLKLVAENKHNFINLNKKRVKDGTHNFLGSSNPSHKRVKDGTHNWLNGALTKARNIEQVANGTHPFLGGAIQSRSAKNQLLNGTHPSQLLHTCPHCNKTMGKGQYKRWHGDNCKLKSI